MAAGRKVEVGLAVEALCAGALGVVAAWLAPPKAFDRIDELVLVYLSIIVAASVPGVALTAAAARPTVTSVKEAYQIGQQLDDQVRFWLGFLGWGSLAAVIVIVGHACEWHLDVPRPGFVPAWFPQEGGRWLMLAATTAVAFTAIRSRRIGQAIHSLIALGTLAHAEQAEANRLARARDIADQVAALPRVPGRGDPVERQRA